jgi:hypothetical protein
MMPPSRDRSTNEVQASAPCSASASAASTASANDSRQISIVTMRWRRYFAVTVHVPRTAVDRWTKPSHDGPN